MNNRGAEGIGQRISKVEDHGAPHPKSDINRLYMPRGKVEGV